MEHEISEQEMEGKAFTGAGKPRTNGKAPTIARGEAPTIAPKAQTILEEAATLIDGDRNAAYGSYHEESRRIAAMWSVILRHEVRPEQVPLCMMALKLVREANKHKRDSLVDICGYAALLDRLYEKPS